MKKLFLLLLAFILVSCSTAVQGQSIEAEPLSESTFQEDLSQPRTPVNESLIGALQTFSARTSAQVLSKENMVYSPLSYYLALSMVTPMATGDTKTQLESFLINETVDQTFFKSLEFNNEVGTLSFANSLWLQQDLPFKTPLMKKISQDMRASIYSVDFKEKESTKEKINEWINTMTHDFIKDVDVVITKDMIASLINTIYLKDNWLVPFKEELTATDIFHLDNNSDISLDYMNQKEILNYVEKDTFKLISKPLMNKGQVHFVYPTNDLNDLLSDEALLQIQQAISQTTPVSATISIPKFDVSGDHELIDISKALGLKLPFDETNAEIYPFENETNAFISVIKQQARFTMDELGIEAAAYTEVGMDTTAMPDYLEITLKFDKPFLVLITTQEDIPLFVATVVDPTK